MKAIIPTALAVLCGVTNAEDLTLVEDGAPRAEIVIPASRPRMTTLAALELRHFVERISGTRLPIVTNPSPAVVRIHVGESDLTRQFGVTAEGLRHGAYRIATGPGWGVLLGVDWDFDPGKMPWPRKRSDVPRAAAEWKELTVGKSDAAWGFPFGAGFKSLWNPGDFTRQMSAHYGADFAELWGPSPGIWNYDLSGSMNAVHDLLRQLGARFFMPGKMGETLPCTATLAIQAQDTTVRPDYALRDWMWYNYSTFAYEDIVWARRLGMNSSHETLGPLKGPHGMVPVLSAPEMKARHPEYYALIAGQRDTAHREGGTPCFTSPGMRAETARYLRFLFDAFDLPAADIWPVDGLKLCQCENCGGKSASELVWGFADAVAVELLRSHPGKLITCGAYTSYLHPPVAPAKLSPNLAVWIANAARPLMNDPTHWTDYTALVAAWRGRIAPGNLLRLENNRYHIWGDKAPIAHPVIHPRGVARDLRFLKGISLGDTGEQNQAGGAWRAAALDHLTLYVQSRFLWDAGQDLDALMKDYFDRFYGPAAQAMCDAIAHAERTLAFKDQSRSRGRSNPANVTPAVAMKLRDLLDTARLAVPGSTIHGQRVQAFIDALQPRADVVEKYRQRDETLAAARAAAPIATRGTEHRLADNQGARQLPAAATTFRVDWEDGVLIFDIVCHEPEMAKLNASRDVHNGDCVAISIETPLHSYYHIEVNPDGHLFEGSPGGDWKSLAQVQTERGQDFWRVKLRLPVVGAAEAQSDPRHRIAGEQPTTAAPWWFNVGRQRVLDLKKNELQAFSPTRGGWHQPEKFARLTLD